MKLRKEIFEQLIQSLNHYEYCFLRNYQDLPNYNNDIDILISKKDKYRTIDKLTKELMPLGIIKLQQVEFSCTSVFFYDTVVREFIHIDFFDSLKWKVFEYLNAEEILKNRQKYRNFYIPDNKYEGLELLLTRLIYQRKVKKAYKNRIYELISKINTDEISNVHYHKLLQLVQDNQWERINRNASKLRFLIIMDNCRHPFKLSNNLWLFFKRVFKRFFKSPGMFIVFLGPDGSGKSTQINHLLDRLKGMYSDKFKTFHFKPNWKYKKPLNIAYTRPHNQLKAGFIRSVLKMMYYVVLYQWGYWTQVKPILASNGLVIFDRYFHDILIDPIRYRYYGPKWLVKLFNWFIPSPDMWVLLDASASIIQMRKQEVSYDESNRQCQAYRILIDELSKGVKIDASLPVYQTLDNIEDSFVNFLLKRELNETI